MGAGSSSKAKSEPALVDGKTAHMWNLEGVAMKAKTTEEILQSMDCYLNAIAAEPGNWLGYQNAGHCCIQLQWWEGSIWYHQRVRELDTAYDKRADADKCACLDHARQQLALAKQRDYARLWHFEDVTPPGLDLAQLAGEAAVDPCWTARRTLEGKFLLRINGQPFVFDSLAQRQHVVSGLLAICREREARAAQERLVAGAEAGHAVLRSDVLQHVLSFLTDDWRGESMLVGDKVSA